MKYYICEEDNETLVVKKEISEEEFAHWKKCTEQLKYYSLATEYQIINPFFLECESESDLTGANLFSLGLDKLKRATDEFARLPNAKITYIGPEQIINKNNKS